MLLKAQCSLSITLAVRMDGEIGFLFLLSIFCLLNRYLLLSSVVNLLSWYQKKIWIYQASLVHGILLVVYVANFPLLILKNKMIEKVKDICEVANFLELDFLVYLDSCRVKYSH